MDNEAKAKVPALIRWLAYHYNNHLKIHVSIGSSTDYIGYVVGYAEGILALQTSTQDAMLIRLDNWTVFSSEYTDGVPAGYPGFETKPAKNE